MNTVFLDTVGLLAVWDKSDQWHAGADRVYRELISRRDELVTSSLVLLECGNAAARRPFRNDVDDIRKVMERKGKLVFPTEADWTDGWQNYRSNGTASAGAVDQISFAIMRRLGIQLAFTNDRHFATAGFRTLF